MAATAAAALLAASVAGCVDSADPILPDSHPVFGDHLDLQVYALHGGFAHEPQRAVFNWNGSLYIRARGGLRDVSAFTVHPFENGDYLIQETSTHALRLTEYALLHPLADGVYQVLPIDADDADDQTRAAYCHTVGQSSCRIVTDTQLFAFARATAAQHRKNGGLVIRLDQHSRRAAHWRR